MGTRLMETEPSFSATLDRFNEYLHEAAGWSLIDFLRAKEQDARWDDLAVVQPALVAVEVALAKLWASRNITPDGVLGQSLGEVAAACVSGALTEADATRVILACSNALKQGQAGTMMLVGLDAKGAERVAAQHSNHIFVAGHLSPNFTVFSGNAQTLKEVGRALRNDGILSQRIKIPAAAHCPYVEQGAETLRKALATLVPQEETTPFFSSVTGTQLSGTSLDAEYWVNLVIKPMAFQGAAEHILNAGPTAFIEVSPHAILTGMLEDLIEAKTDSKTHSVSITQRQNKDPQLTIQNTQKKLLALAPPPKTKHSNINGTHRANEAAPVPGSSTGHSEELGEAYAIVGMSCRLPGDINSADEFWEMLYEGREVIDDVPEDRWDVDAFYDPDQERAIKTNKMYTRRAGFLQGMYDFDAAFFQISPREAEGMDPQHRLLLETSWKAIEHAGIAPSSLVGSRTGVFTGVASNFQEMISLGSTDGAISPYSVVGSTASAASGRVAFLLGLSGPAISIDTACSSSLTALHLACQSLGLRETDMALVGGVNSIASPSGIIARCQSRMMSPKGRCHSFDEAADGYVPSEACGVVIVKRLEDAQRDGDRVLAVIRSIAANQDGRSAGGMMVPSRDAQEAVIRTALNSAGLSPDSIQFVEAHGTGTPVGDPIELNALQSVYGDRTQHLLVGSAKANVGHCESAAGVVSIIKTVLSLQNREIAPHPHFNTPTPAFDWASGKISVPTEPTPWPTASGPRRGGINSFGISGTNVHVILEEAPLAPVEHIDRTQDTYLLPISARTEKALHQAAEQFSQYLNRIDQSDFSDVCATLAQGRSHFNYRLALVAKSPTEARKQLLRFVQGDSTYVTEGMASTEAPPKIAFLFTGQGAQYPGMARDLYEQEPVFKDALDRCATLAEPLLKHSLLSIIFGEVDKNPELIHQTAHTQPALFAIEYALAELWRSWGVSPDAVLGHSIGEYAAACMAGVFSLEDALHLVIERGRLMQSLPLNDGTMAAIFASESEVLSAISDFEDSISIAGINGPENVVISGDAEAINTLCKQFEARGINTKTLEVSHAFHSAKMNPILDAFENAASEITLSEPTLPMISNVTGRFVKPGEVTSPLYWANHIRQPVQFQAGMQALHETGIQTFLEIGPQPILTGMGRACLPDTQITWAHSLRREQPSYPTLLANTGQLYTQGAQIAWESITPLRTRRALPTYPFQHKKFMLGGDMSDLPTMLSQFLPTSSQDHPLIGRPLSSPLLPGPVFEARLGQTNTPILGEHRIYDVPILPFTGYLEMVVAAARKALGEKPYEIERVTVKQAMAFARDVVRTIQVSLTPQQEDRYSFTIFSQASNAEDTWIEHIVGSLKPLKEAPPPPRLTLEQEADEIEPFDIDGFYEKKEEHGVGLSGYFRNVERVNGTAESTIFGQVKLPRNVDPSVEKYSLHPALLDGCIQVMCLSIPSNPDTLEKVYLPTGVGRYRLYQYGCTSVWAVSNATSADGNWEHVTGSVLIYNEEGHLVAEVMDVEFQRVGESAVRRLAYPPLNDWMYEETWKPEPPKPELAPPEGKWLLFADHGGFATALVDTLSQSGATCIVAYASDATKRVDDTTWHVDPTHVEELHQMLKDEANASGTSFEGIVYLWPLDVPEPTKESILRDQQHAMGGLLHALQASIEEVRRIVIVTREGGTYPDPSLRKQSLSQVPSWGLRRSFATDHSEVRSLAVDLPAALTPAEAATILSEEIGRNSESEVTYRDGKRYVSRLKKLPKSSKWSWSDGTPYTLQAIQRGDLDQLSLFPYERRSPGPGEVEIRVSASGLNFRDVLNALGMYPGDPGPLGAECSGRIVAIGEGVTNVSVGDEVIALASGAFSSYVTVPAAFVARNPSRISLAEGATLPITFLTAYYGFHHIANLQPGQRVLIHSAAGGVGTAAIQLALRAGAEVFGTAGSPEKRDRVRAMGVEHVMDSRSVEFEEEVTRLTGGEGVDLVLNALTGPFIPAGLRILKKGGYFLELGKREIWTKEQVDAINEGVNYVPYDLGDVMRDAPMAILEMMQALVQAIEDQDLSPLPVTAFSIHEAQEAFRFMAQARHIGKVVVYHPTDASANAPLYYPDATYLITGGLGGLGLRLAERLVEQGAGNLVLIGRSAPSETAQATIEALRDQDIGVRVASVDVSDAAAVQHLIDDIQATMPPLRGVFHAAGIVRPAAFLLQNWTRYEQVLTPKVAGGWNLHEATRGVSLDHFVLFSSIAAILGSSGQSAYVGANLFLDRLAAYRRTQGLPALSINWGPWDEVGMISKIDERKQTQMANTGLDLIPVERGFDAQEQLLREARLGIGPASAAVGPFTWSKVIIPGLRKHMLNDVITTSDSDHRAAPSKDHGQQVIQQIENAKPEDRRQLIVKDLQQRIARVARLEAEEVPVNASLMTIGLESLMAVEFKSQVEVIYNIDLSVAMLLRGASLEDIADHILQNRFMSTEEATQDPPSTNGNGDGASAEELLARIDTLTEAEVDSLLNEIEDDAQSA